MSERVVTHCSSSCTGVHHLTQTDR